MIIKKRRSSLNQNVKAGHGFIPNGVEEKNLYFYHPDHLGSSSYITDRNGEVIQHTEYIAFGETFVDEHSVSNKQPYLFNGKELDYETGLYYYGARYYDAKTSLWLNVDPLAEKYPNISPYTYVANNPIRYIDPDGKRIIVPQESDRQLVLKYLGNIYGENNFSFNEDGHLSFIGNAKNMSREQRNSLTLINKAIEVDYDINIKLSNFDDTEAQDLMAKANFVSTEGGALSKIYINENGGIMKVDILIDPDKITNVPLYSISYSYKDNNGEIVNNASSCPNGAICARGFTVMKENGKVVTAPKSVEATLIHEIAHPIYEGKNQGNVNREENRVRKILNIPTRTENDPEHQ